MHEKHGQVFPLVSECYLFMQRKQKAAETEVKMRIGRVTLVEEM